MRLVQLLQEQQKWKVQMLLVSILSRKWRAPKIMGQRISDCGSYIGGRLMSIWDKAFHNQAYSTKIKMIISICKRYLMYQLACRRCMIWWRMI